MGTTRLFYARALLVAGGMQRGPQYEQALVAVMTGEDSAATWNPLDTTLPRPGATPYNSFGPNSDYHVWNYPTPAEGIAATLATMEQPNMARWFDAMRTEGKTATQLMIAFSLTPWGGIGDKLPFEIAQEYAAGRRNYVADRRNQVYGCGHWPYMANGEPQPPARPVTGVASQ